MMANLTEEQVQQIAQLSAAPTKLGIGLREIFNKYHYIGESQAQLLEREGVRQEIIEYINAHASEADQIDQASMSTFQPSTGTVFGSLQSNQTEYATTTPTGEITGFEQVKPQPILKVGVYTEQKQYQNEALTPMERGSLLTPAQTQTTVNPFTNSVISTYKEPKTGPTVSILYNPITGTVSKETYVGGQIQTENLLYGYPSQTVGGSMTTSTLNPSSDIINAQKSANEREALTTPTGGFAPEDIGKGVLYGTIMFVPGVVETGFNLVKTGYETLIYGPGIAVARGRQLVDNLISGLTNAPVFTISNIGTQAAIGIGIGKAWNAAKKPSVSQSMGVEDLQLSIDDAGNIRGAGTGEIVTLVNKKATLSQSAFEFMATKGDDFDDFVKSQGKTITKTTQAKDIFGRTKTSTIVQTTEGITRKVDDLTSLTKTSAVNVIDDLDNPLVPALQKTSSEAASLTQSKTLITKEGLPVKTVNAGVTATAEGGKITGAGKFVTISRIDDIVFTSADDLFRSGTTTTRTGSSIAAGQLGAAAESVKSSILKDIKPPSTTLTDIGKSLAGSVVTSSYTPPSKTMTETITIPTSSQSSELKTSSRTFEGPKLADPITMIKRDKKQTVGSGLIPTTGFAMTGGSGTIPVFDLGTASGTGTGTTTAPITDTTATTDTMTRTSIKTVGRTGLKPTTPQVTVNPQLPPPDIISPPILPSGGSGRMIARGMKPSRNVKLKYNPSLGGVFGLKKPIAKAPKVVSGLGIRPLIKSSVKTKSKKGKGLLKGLF